MSLNGLSIQVVSRIHETESNMFSYLYPAFRPSDFPVWFVWFYRLMLHQLAQWFPEQISITEVSVAWGIPSRSQYWVVGVSSPLFLSM